ncbi:MAG: hypothetical protein AB1465_04865 [Patescibacteria group bacterium]
MKNNLLQQIEELLVVLEVLNLQNARLVGLSLSGVGGTKVCILQNRGKRVVVKYGRAKIPLKEQIANRDLLARHFDKGRLPVVKQYLTDERFGEAILIEFCGDFNFHEVVTRGILSDAVCKDIKKSMLSEVIDVWRKTKRQVLNCDPDDIPFSYDPRKRTQRVIRALQELEIESEEKTYRLGDHFDKPVYVNGVLYPSFGEITKQLLAFYPPTVLVTCHRDLNADNFMISLVNGEPHWTLIDWEWAGENHDWRLGFSHLIGWWKANAIYLRRDPTSRLIDNSIMINYDIRTPNVCRDIITLCKDMGKEFGREVSDDNLESQLKLYVATYLLGEVRFVEGRAREEYIIPLIGEGIVTLFK